MKEPRTSRVRPGPNDSRYLSRLQVARLFGVSASTVTRWARLGMLHAVRTPGGHYRFPAEETRKTARDAGAVDTATSGEA
ncbi:MAG TPA: helix-turn-helix domain-containing protein [Thermoanaerobaculia bacterium]|nr:helix-turn-helix domain-containing protein [Thermoanaerobaculia bacterium]